MLLFFHRGGGGDGVGNGGVGGSAPDDDASAYANARLLLAVVHRIDLATASCPISRGNSKC